MAPVPFRLSVCNEIFGETAFLEVCLQIREAGYTGVEIAPATLADDATALTQDERKALCRHMLGESLCFAGLNWGLSAPDWIQLTTRDESLRTRSWEYLHSTINLCADLSVCKDEFNSVMVLGSPKQRSAAEGMTKREATDVFTHGLAHAAPLAESRGVRLIINSLPPDQTDVVTSLDEAVAIVRQVGSPALQTMFDTRTAPAEQETHAELVRRYAPYLHHVYVSEADGREPGTGDYDFAALFAALSATKYHGWISLPFSEPMAKDLEQPGSARQMIERALQTLQKEMPELALTQTV